MNKETREGRYMEDPSLGFETRAAQAGGRTRIGDTVSTVGPIAASTTFTYDSVDEIHEALATGGEGFAYSRNANPTVDALEAVLASLEGTDSVVAFGSGMAAMHAALLSAGLETGDSVLVASDLYGVTRSLMVHLQQFGIDHASIDILNLAEVERALERTGARVLCFESISNPLLRVANVGELVRIAHAHRALAVVDNTFASPYLFRPAEIGVDLVVHSATKYVAGHGDVTAGYVASNRSFGKRMRETRTVTGSILSPFEAWLTMRGVKTLPLRMERQCDSAARLATWLQSQEWVEHVYYPGLRSGDEKEHARHWFGDRYGGMVAFDLQADEPGTLRFMDHLEVITSATSLGDAMSLILYPKLSSHRTLPPAERQRAGIGDTLLRLSVGLESPQDLIRDLERAALRAGIVEAATAALAP
jgi:cystathionine beta-lyase/cystathionine gamma-synthase